MGSKEFDLNVLNEVPFSGTHVLKNTKKCDKKPTLWLEIANKLSLTPCYTFLHFTENVRLYCCKHGVCSTAYLSVTAVCCAKAVQDMRV